MEQGVSLLVILETTNSALNLTARKRVTLRTNRSSLSIYSAYKLTEQNCATVQKYLEIR